MLDLVVLPRARVALTLDLLWPVEAMDSFTVGKGTTSLVEFTSVRLWILWTSSATMSGLILATWMAGLRVLLVLGIASNQLVWIEAWWVLRPVAVAVIDWAEDHATVSACG